MMPVVDPKSISVRQVNVEMMTENKNKALTKILEL